MAEERTERRLAAIMSADVAGYSRLMGKDEAGTLSALKALRKDVFAPLVTAHKGRVVKLMGDGALVEFPSVVDAVDCAIAVQRALADRAANEAIRLRIGINLGDIIIEGSDIYGDGVNVAARIQEVAEPGGVALSAAAHDQVAGKVEAAFEDAGEHELKNIDKPVRVYRWTDAATDPIPSTAGAESALPLPYKPSIAVLPFTNMSGDPDQEYFSDGITEDIITALARCRWLRVVARNSTFAYKDKSADVRRIADELSVRYVLEGSVRRSSDRVRVTAQLIDGRDGKHLWAERYDRDLKEIFALQDEITAVIVGTIEPELEMLEGAALRGRPIVDLSAWDCYQRGLWHLYRFTTEELETAKTLFERAIELDPCFAQAYARLAYVQIQLGWYGPRADRAERVKDATSLASQAIELDNRDAAARLSLGRALTLSGAAESGVEELRTAVALDPSFSQAHFALGQALCFLERHDEAIRELDEAIRLSPRDPHLWTFLNVRAIAHYIANDLEQAEADGRAALRQSNATFWPYFLLVAILGRQDKTAEAKEAIEGLRRLRPGFTYADAIGEWYFGDHPFMTQRFIDQFAADVRNAGLLE